MEIAFRAAFERLGRTSPNPAVGAVLVKNNKIISVGATRECGCDHAEVCAVKGAGGASITADSDLYVTLEPCCHFGRTPPCTDLIISSKIKNVYIAAIDPNPLVAGKGVEKLINAGINIEIISEFENSAKQLIAPFTTRIQKKRPRVIHKSAMTLDGKTADLSGKTKWISSIEARQIVHRLRARVDAVVIGKNTFTTDDPLLNVRLDHNVKFNNSRFLGNDNFIMRSLLSDDFTWEGNNPKKIIVGLPDRIDLKSPFFRDDNYIIFAGKSSVENYHDSAAVNLMKTKNTLVEIIACDNDIFIDELMKGLYDKGFTYILLEGGAKLAYSFLKNKMIDDILFFYSKKIFSAGTPLYDGNNLVDCSIINSAYIQLENDLGVFGNLEYGDS